MKKMAPTMRGLPTFLPTSIVNVTAKHPGAATQKRGWPDWDMRSVGCTQVVDQKQTSERSGF